MKKLSSAMLSLCASVAFLSAVEAQTVPMLPQGTRALVIEILGQSNANGSDAKWNTLTDDTKAIYNEVANYTRVWERFVVPSSSSFVPLEPGFALGSTTAEPFIGPEMSLARFLHDHYSPQVNDIEIFIIKYAVPNTILRADAMELDWSASSTGELFDKWRSPMSSDARRAILNLGYQKDEVVHLGVVWAQGYTDARNYPGVGAQEYGRKLVDFMAAVRDELAQESPFVVVQTVEPLSGGFPDLAILRRTQEFIGTRFPYCAFSSTAGLALDPTFTVHMTARSQIVNGQRIGAALIDYFAVNNAQYLTLADL